MLPTGNEMEYIGSAAPKGGRGMVESIIFGCGVLFLGFSIGRLTAGWRVGDGIRYAKQLPTETDRERIFALGYLECLGHMNDGVPKRPQEAGER
jgi:hypothetical protein